MVHKKVVYNCRIGSGFHFFEPIYINEGWDHICFTNDMSLSSEHYKIVYINSIKGDNRRTAKRVKILAHEYLKDYDISVYLGSRFKIRYNLDELIKCHFSENIDIVCVRHNKRKCIYEEAKKVIELGLDDKYIVEKQMQRYRDEGFPQDMGLASFFVFIRRHNNFVVKEFMNRWYNEILIGSSRDLLSFNYVLWKYPLKVNYLSWVEYYNIFR